MKSQSLTRLFMKPPCSRAPDNVRSARGAAQRCPVQSLPSLTHLLLLLLLLWHCRWETKSLSLSLSHQSLLQVTSWRQWLYSLDHWTAFGTGAKSVNGNLLPASCSDILLLLASLGRFFSAALYQLTSPGFHQCISITLRHMGFLTQCPRRTLFFCLRSGCESKGS